MKIHFLLPTPGQHPVGGYKVVYEYANGLAAKGHDVTVTHQLNKVPNAAAPRQWARYAKWIWKDNWRPNNWFKVDNKVHMRLVCNCTSKSLGDADVLVATAWETAEIVSNMPVHCGRKFYFIQHFEEWSGDRERVLATWKLPLQKIVIAEWLRQIAEDQGEAAYYIPNGVDFKAFGIDVPPDARDPHTVIMLYHDFDWKGSVDGLTSLRAAKAKVPELKVILFGVPEKPDGLESWFEYYRLPTQALLRNLYNRAAIFLSPSWAEGWPLPPAEAMLCGTATVLTDIGGHREYGIEGMTTLFGQSHAPDSLVPPLLRLLTDPAARIAQSLRARDYINQFTWDIAVSRIETVLKA